MSDSERLLALRKIYADVILNTGKEAAARIMVSERKAFQYQQELAETKEEALRMLMRFKQMLDAKDNEAQMTYNNKQRKIDELEAQLQEAQDIVKDLGEDLQGALAELERVPYKHLNEKNLKTTAAGEGMAEDNRLKSNEYMDCSCHRNNFQYRINSQSDESSVAKPEFVSKSMRNGELQLHKCDQRIHGCEQNPINRKLTFSGKINEANNDSPDRGHVEHKDLSVQPTAESEDVCNKEEDQREHKKMHADGFPEEVHAIKSLNRKRKRVHRKKYEAIQVDYCLDEIPVKSLCEKTTAFTDHQASVHVSVKKSNRSNKNSFQINGYRPQTTSKKPTISKSFSDTTETDSLPGYAEVSESDTEIVNDSSAADSENIDEMSKSDLIRQENGSAKSQDLPACKADIETLDLSLVESVPEVSNARDAVQRQDAADNIIKYTYQRRQKKESLSSSDDNSSIKKCNSYKKEDHKQNGSLETQKSTSLPESTRESRRLKQLLSLSENKRRY